MNRNHTFTLGALLISCVASSVDAQGRQGADRRGGPPVEYRTAVPPIDFNVLLARPTATQVTLSVLSRSDRVISVSLQPSGRTLQDTVRADVPREITISALTPNQRYQYRISASDTALAGAFQTARAAGSPFRFVIQADSHLDGNTDPAVYSAALRNMLADSADFLMDLGDTFMTDKYRDFHDATSQYYAQRYYFGLIGHRIPAFLVAGNHDGETARQGRNDNTMSAWSAAQRIRYFPPIRDNEFYSAGTPSQNYYAWQWGDATFIVLDPFTSVASENMARPPRASGGWGWTLGRTQYDWLRKTLQRNRSRYTFVFIHHLVGGNGNEARGGAEASRFFEWGGANVDGTPGFAAQRPGWEAPIHDLLVRNKVTAVFHGHDHLYVHQERDGIVYQEVPQPGFSRDGGTRSAVEYGYLSGTILGSPGHLRVSVGSAKTTVEYVRSSLRNDNGRVADQYDLQPADGQRRSPAPTGSVPDARTTAERVSATASNRDGNQPTFTLSPAVAWNGATMPAVHTCDGEGISPALVWSNPPKDTKEFALLMTTIPRDGNTKWNWVLYGIPATASKLDAGSRGVGVFGVGSDGPQAAYQPPCSQGPGPKRYTFTIHALSRPPVIPSGRVTGAVLTDAIAPGVLASASFTVTYSRSQQSTARDRVAPRAPVANASVSATEVSSSACENIRTSLTGSTTGKATATCDAQYAYITSNALPSHSMMNGITATNLQVPISQNFSGSNAWRIPLAPSIAPTPTNVDDGPIGIAVNGVPIFNPCKQGGCQNGDTKQLGELDVCNGHAGRADDYHYHAAPTCMMSERPAQYWDTHPIGWALDGFAIFGFNDANGKVAVRDNICGGNTNAVPNAPAGYSYHVTNNMPYVLSCLRGVPSPDLAGQARKFSPIRPPPVRPFRVSGMTLTDSADGTRELRFTTARPFVSTAQRNSDFNNAPGTYRIRYTPLTGDELAALLKLPTNSNRTACWKFTFLTDAGVPSQPPATYCR